MMKAFKKVYNKMQQKLDLLLQQIVPNQYKYNGDGRVMSIGTKLPDFVNEKRKKLIQFNGDFWHQDVEKDRKRLQEFQKHGYETLVVWQSELLHNKELVKEKVLNFTFNPGIQIVSVVNVEKIDASKVYDIQVEKHHNFFARGILVHNSEMFGKMVQNPANELTKFYPRSPYGVSKVYAYYMTKNYRQSYGMYAVSGILFNHQSERRGKNFVTRKITWGIKQILEGKQKYIQLGNLDAMRDWGYAGDYVKAMHLMLQQEQPDDYVVATGQSHSIREFLQIAFKYAGLGNYEKYVKINPIYFRPAQVDCLRGDYSKIAKLGWAPETSFEDLVKLMVDSDLREIKK